LIGAADLRNGHVFEFARLGTALVNALIARLATLGPLSRQAEEELLAWCNDRRSGPRKRDFVVKGTSARQGIFLLRGWAARYTVGPQGTRKIIGILLPGDPINLFAETVVALDHDVIALTDVEFASVDARRLAAAALLPDLRAALLQASLVELAIARNWLSQAGRRTAREMLAHLLCELAYRQRHLVEGDSIPTFDMIQSDLADAVGLTAIHLNRTLQELRHLGLVSGSAHLKIDALEGLRKLAHFDPSYFDKVNVS